MKKKKKQKQFEEKVQKVYYRLQEERIQSPNTNIFARLMASNVDDGKLNVKIVVKITDESFYCKQIKLWYSAGAEEFHQAEMDKIDDKNYALILANIPIGTTVLYYIEMLDRGGVWIKRLRDEIEQMPFEFSTNKNGIEEISDWNDPSLIKCDVCDYMCKREWDECPQCHTPLHDNLLKQELFEEDQKSKMKKREIETDRDALAWKNQDEKYEQLPECPSCGYSYQESWTNCPICGFDLTSNPKNKNKSLKDSRSISTKQQDFDVL